MPFRFIHTADLHLDSPLRSLSLRNAELAALIGDGTRRALVRIVDLALEERVDAVLIAGDLYDGDQTSMKTARFLAAQLGRLDAAEIATYIIRGNHDAMSRITKELVLPESVKLFRGRAEVVEIERGGLPVAIHGLSFAEPQAPESLLPKYRPAVGGAVNIGLMHTSLDGAPGHDNYAPCSLVDLAATGFDYWALGHIHLRAAHDGVVMPGMPQGRDINEAGDKTVSLVTITDDRQVLVEERLVSEARFERLTIDVTGLEDWRELPQRLEAGLAPLRDATRSPQLVARVTLAGTTPLAFKLRRDADLLRAEAEQAAERVGRSWVEKLELAVSPPGSSADAGDGGALAELDRLMRADIAGDALREDVGRLVRELTTELPAELRDGFGGGEAALAGFVESLLREAEADVVARLDGGRDAG